MSKFTKRQFFHTKKVTWFISQHLKAGTNGVGPKKERGQGSQITDFEITSFMNDPTQKYMFAGKVIRFPLYEVNKAARYTMSVGLLY